METDFNENADFHGYSTASSDEYFTDSTEDSDVEDDSQADEVLNTAYENRLRKNKLNVEHHSNNNKYLVANTVPYNLLQKLRNREHFGCFSTGHGYTQQQRLHMHLPQQRAFIQVPNRLGFCLKDIIPPHVLQSHVFLGLTVCGQFLLSYKIGSDGNATPNSFNFNCSYKYSLHFWHFRPHQTVRLFYVCRLFDDHGIDSYKEVTITQWKSEPRILIIHGAAENEHENSYITYVKVPKVGCLDCKKLRESYGLVFMVDALSGLCLKCSLTIHTKYPPTDSERKFNPYMNLICPGRILIVANGLMHMLHVELELPPTTKTTFIQLPQLSPSISNSVYNGSLSDQQQQQYQRMHQNSIMVEEEINGSGQRSNNNRNDIVERILADFSDIESSDSTTQSSQASICPPLKACEELVFTCGGDLSSAGGANGVSSSTGEGLTNAKDTKITNIINGSLSGGTATRVSLLRHQTGGPRRNYRIVTKSFRNGHLATSTTTATTATANMLADALSPSTSLAAANSSSVDKSNAYEFSEDNEKCEKISTLRKRRLAEKKYEFSEENSENIIPFAKMRSARKQTNPNMSTGINGPAQSLRLQQHHRSFTGSPNASPSSSPRAVVQSSSQVAAAVSGASPNREAQSTPLSHLLTHRSSPIAQQVTGFRSPPYSPPYGMMRSPNSRTMVMAHMYSARSPPSAMVQQMLNFKPLGTLSPLQVSLQRRNHLELTNQSLMSPNHAGNVPFLSPRREEHNKVIEISLQDNVMPEKPQCTKKFKRRYVEEDDAASVITSEEDDCISPGYHTALPLEVHGACYSEMQMISQSSYQQLSCASAVVTQHSFDLEAFTYYVISALCQKNQKTYDVFLDWACEIINVCPHSYTISCLLMAQFTARDQIPLSPSSCLNCSRRLDCAFHRRQYECRILFTWNMDSGEWEVLDYGELTNLVRNSEFVSPTKRTNRGPEPSLTQRAKKLANEINAGIAKLQDHTCTLRVLDSDLMKPKKSIVDFDNMIEFHLKRRRPY